MIEAQFEIRMGFLPDETISTQASESDLHGRRNRDVENLGEPANHGRRAKRKAPKTRVSEAPPVTKIMDE